MYNGVSPIRPLKAARDASNHCSDWLCGLGCRCDDPACAASAGADRQYLFRSARRVRPVRSRVAARLLRRTRKRMCRTTCRKVVCCRRQGACRRGRPCRRRAPFSRSRCPRRREAQFLHRMRRLPQRARHRSNRRARVPPSHRPGTNNAPGQPKNVPQTAGHAAAG